MGAKFFISDAKPNSFGQIKQLTKYVLPRSQSLNDPPRYDNELCFVHSLNWAKSPTHIDNWAFIKAVVDAVKDSNVSPGVLPALSVLITHKGILGK
jgi:hypothetical protein